MLHVLQELEKHAHAMPASVAVRSVVGHGPNIVTHGQLHEQVVALAQSLKQCAEVGSTVLLCCPNQPRYIAAFLSALASRRIIFPVAPESAAPEVDAVARISLPAAAVTDQHHVPLLSALFEQSTPLHDGLVLLFHPVSTPATRDGPALLLQSSGTTAAPKIVHRDAASLDAVTTNMVNACGFTSTDRLLATVPLCHSYGLEHGILAPIAAGSCVHLCEKFDLPLAMQELRQRGITVFPGVPFMFEMICRAAAERFPALRLAYSAGGPLPSAVADEFLQRFDLRIGQVYGATEIGSVTFNDPLNANFNPGSVGLPMTGVQVVILDPDNPRIDQPSPPGTEGCIAIKAPSMFRGYLDAPNDLLNGGFFLTGDLGFVEPDGSLRITGRLKLLIDIGGRKVNPLEVEAVLSHHPDVGSSVVLPLRLSDSVQRLKAIVTPARPDVQIQIQDLRRFARERLSAYKVPRVFEVRAQLPLSAAGKIQRRLVEAS